MGSFLIFSVEEKAAVVLNKTQDTPQEIAFIVSEGDSRSISRYIHQNQEFL
jgi:hypothetical protein